MLSIVSHIVVGRILLSFSNNGPVTMLHLVHMRRCYRHIYYDLLADLAIQFDALYTLLHGSVIRRVLLADWEDNAQLLL